METDRSAKARFHQQVRESHLGSLLQKLAVWRRQIRRFLDSYIWDQDLSQKSWFIAFLYRQLRVGVILIKGCVRGRIALRASAMTFTTLLTLVPLLILTFSIIRALGGFGDLEIRLEGFILDNIAPGSQQQVQSWMLDFFRSVRAGTYNGISLMILLGGGLGLLGTVEGAFNDVWGIHRGRNLFHRFSTYTTIIFFGPLLIGLSLSMTASLKTSELWDGLRTTIPVASFILSALFQLIPIILTCIAFTLMYVIIPNARVRVRAALPAGFAAGVLWEISKWGYGLYLGRATHYGALYGSLAAIPLFMVWVYLTWLVVLFGAHLTFAQESADDIRIEEGAVHAGLKDRFAAGLYIILTAAACHRTGQPPPDLAGLARRLGLPLRLFRIAAEILIEGKLLLQVSTHSRDWALVPAQDPEGITLLGIWHAFCEVPEGGGCDEGEVPKPRSGISQTDPPWREVESLLLQMESALDGTWGKITLAQLLDRLLVATNAMPETPRLVSFPKKSLDQGQGPVD
ncbi:MAG: YihY/virulence factor BrkB family protein [Candidatus Eisenbacteria bacterium]|uniref:YihY/virulence factor BrkB family protein n=1 Tax=Eiseniibacteriota bacterium TaxID=2212470 RepID=A0A948RXE1_UNCEI|nr:YihY/virulence factor BrkB family protein [Candidatus Eisenbacteria bacterium]MBU1950818.1 YihY/virulence factor BrkB family protein [Candidatus Eisenbacteria bacterium]MBU2692793.1 YihY/virulence factor BrkB family protein [Candidatus Eisenbacteria bacterium]